MKETKNQSIEKTISYRIIFIILLALITCSITGDLLQMTSIVVVFQSIQMVNHYFHEQV